MATATKSRSSSRHRSGQKTPRGESAGPRSMWSGSISFGLVNIPVRLSPAVREQRVAFHLLHDQDKARLRRKMVCPADGKEVHPEHIVRGYAIGKDKHVIVSDEELEACAPEKTRAIEITDFVDLDQIDSLYFDRPYYLLPQPGAAKSYRLLAEAMDRTKKVGVARFVLHDKEHLCALRTKGRLICLETMHFGDEVVEAGQFAPSASAGEREMKVAQQLIDSMTEPFDPGRYRDEWRDCVRKVLQKKAEGDEVVASEAEVPEDKPKTARAVDLMAALEASLAKARSAAGGNSHSDRNGNGHSNGHSNGNGHANGNGSGHHAKPRAGAARARSERRAARPKPRRRARA